MSKNQGLGAIDYTSPLSGHDLMQFLNSAVRSKYGATEHQLGQAKKDMPGWYQNYRKTLRGTEYAGDIGNQIARDAVGAQTAAQQTADTQQAQTLFGSMGADAANRGASIDPSLAGVASGASSATAANGQAFQNLLQLQGQGQHNYVGNLATISRGDQHLEHQKLNDAFSQLHQNEGDYRVSTLMDMIDKERQYKIAEDAALGSAQTAQDTNAYRAASLNVQAGLMPDGSGPNAATRAKNKNNAPSAQDKWANQDDDGDGIPNGKDNMPEVPGYHNPNDGSGGGKGKDKYGNTAVQVRGNNNSWNAGLRYARSLDPSARTPDALSVGLSQIKHTPDDIAQAVIDWATNSGTLSRKDWKLLTHLGVKIPKSRIRTMPESPGYGSDTATG